MPLTLGDLHGIIRHAEDVFARVMPAQDSGGIGFFREKLENLSTSQLQQVYLSLIALQSHVRALKVAEIDLPVVKLKE